MIAVLQKWWTGAFTFRAAAADNIIEHAKRRVAQLSNSQLLLSKMPRTKRWLVVWLMLLNAGEAWLSLPEAAAGHKSILLGLLFGFGAFVSLANGWVMQLMMERQNRFLAIARTSWLSVICSGTQSHIEEEVLWRQGRKALREAIAIPILALFTACGFMWIYSWFIRT